MHVITAHGAADMVAPVENSQRMVKAMRAHGNDITYLEIESASHSSVVSQVLDEIVRFFDAHRRGGP